MTRKPIKNEWMSQEELVIEELICDSVFNDYSHNGERRAKLAEVHDSFLRMVVYVSNHSKKSARYTFPIESISIDFPRWRDFV